MSHFEIHAILLFLDIRGSLKFVAFFITLQPVFLILRKNSEKICDVFIFTGKFADFRFCGIVMFVAKFVARKHEKWKFYEKLRLG